MRRCSLCAFDAVRGPRRLMRVGLALILVGHVNLLLGAVLHGTVLRHVANPLGAVTPEYIAANVISVGSGLLSVSVGLVALLASRNLLRPPLHWALLALALVNLLLSAACSLGLLLAVSLTVANGGHRLIADCHPGLLDPLVPLDEGLGHTDCPFDPTRIYVSTFSSLWSTKPWSCPFNFPYLPHLPYFLLVPILPSHFSGYSLGSLDPFFAHVCRGGCSIWLLLCGCTHPTWSWALQEGGTSGAARGNDRA
ncbi:keratinocyte-associated protein 3 isoform X1 [Saimiri boliviensis]|uniref:keratinocyte-associated protein 3 isoform X1 n=1 Tax=Saimiri boliviensis TaxID=27679 RepID=UPI003D77FC1E